MNKTQGLRLKSHPDNWFRMEGKSYVSSVDVRGCFEEPQEFLDIEGNVGYLALRGSQGNYSAIPVIDSELTGKIRAYHEQLILKKGHLDFIGSTGGLTARLPDLEDPGF